jgi:hypothetical protein
MTKGWEQWEEAQDNESKKESEIATPPDLLPALHRLSATHVILLRLPSSLLFRRAVSPISLMGSIIAANTWKNYSPRQKNSQARQTSQS